MARAAALQQADRLDAALGAYDVVVTRYPDSEEVPMALLHMGLLHGRLKQTEESIGALKSLINEYPDFERLDIALYELSWTLVEQQRSKEAERYFAQIVESYPESPYWADATYRMADNEARRGNDEPAFAYLDRLIAADHQTQSAVHCLLPQRTTIGEEWRLEVGGGRYASGCRPHDR